MDLMCFLDKFSQLFHDVKIIDVGCLYVEPATLGTVPVFSATDMHPLKQSLGMNAQTPECEDDILTFTVGYAAYANQRPSSSYSQYVSKLETYTMFLRNDGAGSILLTPAPSQQHRRNGHGTYQVLTMDIYPHFVHITKVTFCMLPGLVVDTYYVADEESSDLFRA
jgi:hypothetical protein